MAIEFNGSNQLEINGYDAPSPTGTPSMSFWVRPDALENCRILGSGDNFEILLTNGGNVVVDIFGNGTNSVTTLSIGVWAHLYADGNGTTDTSRLFINGVLETTNTGQNSTTIGTNMFLGWRDGAGVGQRFTGAIADFRLYNRILNPNEITTIYNTVGNDGIINGLIHRFTFNEGPPGSSIGINEAIDIGASRVNGSGGGTPNPVRIEDFLRYRSKPLYLIHQ